MTVETFDFSHWVESSFSESDYVILSLDIEGAEYQVIEKMLQDETMKYVDRLYVEFHPHLVPGVPWPRAGKIGRELLVQVTKLGIMVGDDSAEDMMKRGAWLDFLL